MDFKINTQSEYLNFVNKLSKSVLSRRQLRKLDDTFHNICGKFSNGMEWKKHDP